MKTLHCTHSVQAPLYKTNYAFITFIRIATTILSYHKILRSFSNQYYFVDPTLPCRVPRSPWAVLKSGSACATRRNNGTWDGWWRCGERNEEAGNEVTMIWG